MTSGPISRRPVWKVTWTSKPSKNFNINTCKWTLNITWNRVAQLVQRHSVRLQIQGLSVWILKGTCCDLNKLPYFISHCWQLTWYHNNGLVGQCVLVNQKHIIMHNTQFQSWLHQGSLLTDTCTIVQTMKMHPYKPNSY